MQTTKMTDSERRRGDKTRAAWWKVTQMTGRTQERERRICPVRPSRAISESPMISTSRSQCALFKQRVIASIVPTIVGYVSEEAYDDCSDATRQDGNLEDCAHWRKDPDRAVDQLRSGGGAACARDDCEVDSMYRLRRCIFKAERIEQEQEL